MTTEAIVNTKKRIESIDIARGIIMIIMTLDHVRDFLMLPGPSPLDIQSTSVILFFTRWVTHFCAPTFLFLSGVSAFLAGQKRSRRQLSLFLLSRGIWLILSDLLIISMIFTFDPGHHVLVLEVLWAIGAGMIILSALIWLPLPVIAGIGLLIFFGHNLLDYFNSNSKLIDILFTARASVTPLGGNRSVFELYAVLPWSSVMFMGYAFGALFNSKFNIQNRKRILMSAGIALCVLFLIVRLINHYGDPAPWSVQRNAAHTLLSFLNTTKQTPSLLFLTMTLGPVMLCDPIEKRAIG